MSDRYDQGSPGDPYGHPQDSAGVTVETAVTQVRKVREAAEASHAKYLLWLDTYNAALTGLLMGEPSPDTDLLHHLASEQANRLHGEQS